MTTSGAVEGGGGDDDHCNDCGVDEAIHLRSCRALQVTISVMTMLIQCT